MTTRLMFGNLAVAEFPTNVRMIMTHLLNTTTFRQVIDPTVADMGKIKPTRTHPAETQRRAHATQLLVTKAHVRQFAMNLLKQLIQEVLKTDRNARCLGAKTLRKQTCDLIDRDTTGKFTGIGTAHPIADGKNKIIGRQISLSVLPKASHSLAVNGQR